MRNSTKYVDLGRFSVLKYYLAGIVICYLGCHKIGEATVPSRCMDLEISQTDSIFLDFDIFQMRPKCPASGQADNLLKIKAVFHEGWQITPKIFDQNDATIRIVSHKGVGYWKDTLPTLRGMGWRKIEAFEVGADLAIRFRYRQMLDSCNRTTLEEVSIITPDFIIYEFYGIGGKDLKLYERPKEKDIAIIARDSLIFSNPKYIIMNRRCLKGPCPAVATRFQLRQQSWPLPSYSAFWYWYCFDRITLRTW
jgi:hypothetical protein